MFFYISKHKQENFPCAYQIHNYVINTDSGWTQIEIGDHIVVYKGYADSFDLGTNLIDVINQTEPTHTGNFCALVTHKHHRRLEIKTDKYRSFPIFVSDQHDITNLIAANRIVWSDSLISIIEDFEIHETKFDLIGNIDTTELDLDTALTQIDNILATKTQQLAQWNRLPVKIFLSGGVDTLLVYSYIKKYNVDHSIVSGIHFDWDYFWIKNSGDIQKFWGYKQMLHWTQTSVLASGAPGDEFMLRSPTTANLYLKHCNLDILSLMAQPMWKNCLHREYFRSPKHRDIFQTPVDHNLSKQQLYWQLCNIIVNDWQHWHLGNTLTWTPLRDLEIFKIIMRLPLDCAIGQILNSDVSKTLMDNNINGISQHISDQKNYGNLYSNLIGLVI